MDVESNGRFVENYKKTRRTVGALVGAILASAIEGAMRG